MMCFPLKNFLTIYTLTLLASWGMTQILQLALGNESPGPEEYRMSVGSAIEALVHI